MRKTKVREGRRREMTRKDKRRRERRREKKSLGRRTRSQRRPSCFSPASSSQRFLISFSQLLSLCSSLCFSRWFVCGRTSSSCRLARLRDGSSLRAGANTVRFLASWRSVLARRPLPLSPPSPSNPPSLSPRSPSNNFHATSTRGARHLRTQTKMAALKAAFAAVRCSAMFSAVARPILTEISPNAPPLPAPPSPASPSLSNLRRFSWILASFSARNRLILGDGSGAGLARWSRSLSLGRPLYLNT